VQPVVEPSQLALGVVTTRIATTLGVVTTRIATTLLVDVTAG
jgi:hypothetical protein